ncbi:polysaccharide biosynthesis/export family protein [Rubellimicrobium arenae]|uniref:polysaccharide biosynthesis/export family protein n=1 Tax=Rubellimicrobium arenae TaxID=2817372 RepID=UPI001B31681E|nr:polysaccharide biosynthesis/export family protein [Rubellimicrobium arenae]
MEGRVEDRTARRAGPAAGMRAVRILKGLLYLLVSIGVVPCAWAAMTIGPGDVLRVSILEDAQLSREAPVSVDGTIVLPRLGEIEVAGQVLSDVRAAIEEALRDQGILRSPTVLVEFASYRPFYVGGAVAHPGAIAFEPGLTVRHALILAGGLDATEGRGPATLQDVDDLRVRMQVGSYQLLQIDSLIARLRAELANRPETDAAAPDPGLVPEEEARSLLALDADLLDTRLAARGANEQHLRRALSLVEAEIDILQRQAELQEGEQDLQQQELESARSLVDRGRMPRSQLQALQREASQLSRDLLENRSFTARAEQERAATEHQLEAATTDRVIQIQEELRAAMLERARLSADIESMRDRMYNLGLALGAQDLAARPDRIILIHRRAASGFEEIAAEMETEILPGDVLEVSLPHPPQG